MHATSRFLVVVLCLTSFTAFSQNETPSLCERQLALIEQKHDLKKDSINKVYTKKISAERKRVNKSIAGKSKSVQKSAKKNFEKKKSSFLQSRDLALRLASVRATQLKSKVSLNCSASMDNSAYTKPKAYASTTKSATPTPIAKHFQRETIAKSFEPKSEITNNTSLIKEAKRYIGVPYRWGGNSPKSGFDCSGFICYVYNKMGKHLPRTTNQLASSGKRTQVHRTEPGDLIFFSHKGRGIDHVGMVIQNNGKQLKVIHSSSSSGVVITDIKSSKYWSTRVRKAVKVL